MDRISKLPNPILQHILCFLSQKEATRTCVLAKSWRHHWSTRPVLHFRESFFRGGKQTLLSVLDKTLQRYHRQNLSVQRFRVDVSNFIYVKKWIPMLLINLGVETLHLIYPDSAAPVVFRAQLLTDLYLVGCQIMFYPQYYFPRLKSVHLANVRLPNSSFVCFSSNFPCLEELDLRGCHGFDTVELFNPSIKRLVVLETERMIHTVTVDAPNILYFEFSCGDFPPSPFSFTSTAASSREWKSRVSVPFELMTSSDDISAWFMKLHELLKALRESRITLSLFNHRTVNRHIVDTSHIGFYEPVELEHLSLKDFFSSDPFDALFNWLFRVFRPRYIDMGLYDKRRIKINQLARFLCKANTEEGEFSRGYFWHRDLKEFSIEISDQHSKEWSRVEGSSLIEAQFRQDIRFRFEWRELAPLAYIVN